MCVWGSALGATRVAVVIIGNQVPGALLVLPVLTVLSSGL